MKCYFRVDASHKIGFGHLFRSLALAEELKSDYKIVFLCNDDHKTRGIIENSGFAVITVDMAEEDFLRFYFKDKDSGLIIFDNLIHYSDHLITELKKDFKIILIHSYASSRFLADIALYPAAHLSDDFINDSEWTKNSVELLYGPEWLLLNKKVMEMGPKENTDTEVKNIVLIAGGSDPSDSLLHIYPWIVNHFSNTKTNFKFLFGEACNYKDQVKKYPNIRNIEFIPFSTDQLLQADIAVCAFGVTAYELLYLNIPTITFGHTEMHASASERLEQSYACSKNIGLLADLSEEIFISKLVVMMNDYQLRKELAQKSKNLIDGKGIKRVADKIVELGKSVNYDS